MTDPQADPRLDPRAYAAARYRSARPRLAFPGGDAAAIEAWSTAAKAKLVELLGPSPSAKVPLDPRLGPVVQKEGYTRRLVTFSTREFLAATAWLLVPDGPSKPAPAMLCIPGHGYGADDLVGIDEHGQDRDHHDGYQHDFAIQCARLGMVALALEPMGFGRRRDADARKAGPSTSSCQTASGAALLLGESMVGWRTYDSIRALDLLQTLPEVDPARLGMMGISGGGTITLYTAAVDERIKLAFLSCSFCTFLESIYSITHCIDNFVPGLLNWFEAADLAALIAPRYLFVEGGLKDKIFPEAGTRRALDAAARAFASRGAPDHLAHALFDDGHVFSGVEAFPKVCQWL